MKIKNKIEQINKYIEKADIIYLVGHNSDLDAMDHV